MPGQEIFQNYLAPDEQIVYRCSVHKKFVKLFVVLGIVLMALAGVWIPFMIRGIRNAPAAYAAQQQLQQANPATKFILTPIGITLISIGIFAALLIAGIACIFYSRSLGRRVYLLTDRKVFFSKGGILMNARRMIDLSDICGVERKQNLLTHLFGACSVDFFSPSIGMNKSKFLFIFSLSSSKFSLFGLKNEEAEKFIDLTLKTKENCKKA